MLRPNENSNLAALLSSCHPEQSAKRSEHGVEGPLGRDNAREWHTLEGYTMGNLSQSGGPSTPPRRSRDFSSARDDMTARFGAPRKSLGWPAKASATFNIRRTRRASTAIH